MSSIDRAISDALNSPHVRQIGRNPLPPDMSLWTQFSHLKDSSEAGYKGYLTYENLKLWLEDLYNAVNASISSETSR